MVIAFSLRPYFCLLPVASRKNLLQTISLVLLNQRGDNLLAIRWRRADMSTATLPRIRKASFRIDTTKSHEWLKAHRHEYLGKWVVLDGDRLVGAGDDPQPIFAQARTRGV